MVGFCRALLPFSFLIACIFEPRLLIEWREWPHVWRSMWNEPI